MGVLKNGKGEGKGRRGQGFQQSTPQLPKASPQPAKATEAPLTPRVKANTKAPLKLTNLGVYSEYLLLSPPRSLDQLATLKGLPSVPQEWLRRSVDEGWADEARRFDEAANERRIRANWEAANATQLKALAASDRLLEDIATADRGGNESTKDDAATLANLAATLKTVVSVRFQLLEGLERPDSVSAVKPPHFDQLDRMQMVKAMWGDAKSGYEVDFGD